MSESNEAGEIVRAVNARGVGLQVRFTRVGDRFAHCIELVTTRDAIGVPLLTSVEGDNNSAWPPSATLQQLHIERRDGIGPSAETFSHVALMVGLAGRSHWSLSVEPEVFQPSRQAEPTSPQESGQQRGSSPTALARAHSRELVGDGDDADCDNANGDDGCCSLRFDAACRVSQTPEWLGGTYSLSDLLRESVVDSITGLPTTGLSTAGLSTASLPTSDLPTASPSSTANSVQLQFAAGRLTIETLDSSSVRTRDANPENQTDTADKDPAIGFVAARKSVVEVSAELPAAVTKPTTVRWRYRIVFQPAPTS
ncbi:MAG TPA: hypothetical protein PLV92_14050 [Pirellulaceae bacterium]|nr:hypothetical protein [Pirellulaceae bacterium]